MKKILWIITLCMGSVMQVPAQVPYSGYTMSYFEPFDEYNTMSDLTTNWYRYGDCSKDGLDDNNHVQLITLSGTNKAVRIFENNISAYVDPICSVSHTHRTGYIFSLKTHPAFGIFEASIKMPPGRSITPGNACDAAFWMRTSDNHTQGDDHTEIDVTEYHPDDTFGTYLTGNLIDWTMGYGGDQQGQPVDCSIPNPTWACGYNEPSNGFHLYTLVWTPKNLTYYYDGHLVGTGIPYYLVRSNSYDIRLTFDLETTSTSSSSYPTPDGLAMDIDYVKIWSLNCDGRSITIDHDDNDDNATSLYNIGGMWSYKYITVGGTAVQNNPNIPTVIEADATTIVSNFLATSLPFSSYNTPPNPSNGGGEYFLVRPRACATACGLGPISGPDTVCNENYGYVGYQFTNGAPGGKWGTNDSTAIIDSTTGLIAPPSYLQLGTFTVFYTLDNCTVQKTVTVIPCTEKMPARRKPGETGYINTLTGQSNTVAARAVNGTGGSPNTIMPGDALTGSYAQSNNTAGNTTTDNTPPSPGGNTQVQVYPNPTQDQVNILYPCTTEGMLDISIKDVAGRVRYAESIDCSAGNTVQYSIDFSPFVPGVYYIELTLNNQHVVKKIVKL